MKAAAPLLVGCIGVAFCLSNTCFAQPVGPAPGGQGQNLRNPGPMLMQPPFMGPLPGRGMQQQMPRIEPRGTIEAIAPGMLRIVGPDGQLWTIRIAPNAKIKLTGTMDPALVGPGQFVRFVATVHHKISKVEEPIKELTVFTLSRDDPETQLGAFPEQVTGETADQQVSNPFNQPLGGVEQQGAAPSFRPPSTPPRRLGHSRATRAKQPESETYEIRGRIAGKRRDGSFTIYVPTPYFRSPIYATLAEDATVNVLLYGNQALAFAAKGDHIEAKGVQIGPTMAQVNELTIEKAEMIRPPEKTKPKSSSEKRRADEQLKAPETDQPEAKSDAQ